MSAVSFFLQSLLDFKKVGSFLPSSQALCSQLSHSIQSASSSLVVLEAGSGTGVVADYMLAQQLPLKQLDVVESNPELYRIMANTLSSHKLNAGLVLNTSLSDVASFLEEDGNWVENRYDVIVSSIPLNSLSSDAVMNILKAYQLALKPQGVLCFYEYIGSRLANSMHAIFSNQIRLMDAVNDVFTVCDIDESICLNNFPPARIIEVKSLLK